MRVCSLFAGVGGIDIAFAQAGFETVWANEFDSEACKTFRNNFPNIELIESDIRNISASEIPDFDILTAGFPCQPFSVCGKQQGFADDRGNLFFEICRIIDSKQPAAVFLENVANLEKHDNGNTFKVICEQLSTRGYEIKYTVADACDYGIPQHRTRIYIVAFKNASQSDAFSFPVKRPLTIHVADIIDRSVKADEALYFQPGSRKFEKMAAVIDDEEQLYRFSDYGVQKGKDGISFTLKANMGTWYDREPVIKDRFGIRKLSPKECFLLQGFPENFDISGIKLKDAYKQAGNTVCVPVVREIASSIKQAMASREHTEETHAKTLIGIVKSEKQLNISLEKNFYHIPVGKLKCEPQELKYIALCKSAKTFGQECGIQFYGKIDSYRVLKRREIRELPKSSNELYFRFEINNWETVPGRDYSSFKPFDICMLDELVST